MAPADTRACSHLLCDFFEFPSLETERGQRTQAELVMAVEEEAVERGESSAEEVDEEAEDESASVAVAVVVLPVPAHVFVVVLVVVEAPLVSSLHESFLSPTLLVDVESRMDQAVFPTNLSTSILSYSLNFLNYRLG